MHLIQTIIGIVAGVIAFASYLPYIISILRGKTKPSRATMAIWVVVDSVIAASYIASGARTTVFTAVAYAVMQVIILGLAIKHGMGGRSWLDVACITGAIIGMVAWFITKNAPTALFIATFVELLGFVPTIKKAYLYPDTEDTLAWVMAFLAATLNLIAIDSFSPQISVYPIAIFLGEVLVVSPLLFPKIRPFKVKNQL
jgi:hypothetical protein